MEEINNTPVVEETTVHETSESAAEVTEVEGIGEQTESTEGMTQEQKEAFLRIQYNKQDVELDRDKAVELAQKGMNYDKMYEKLQGLESNPLLKWATEYSKSQGFEDPSKFIEAVNAEQEARQHQQMIDKYAAKFGTEAAEAMAEMQKQLADLQKDNESSKAEKQKNEEYTNFLNWYNQKKDMGVFADDFNANNVPDEVWNMRNDGMSWKEAYSEYMLSNMKTITEQNTLKKLNEKEQTSTGSIQEGNTPTDDKWSHEFIEQMANEKGSGWVKANFAKISKSGYFNQ